jgi:hypothetical protein
MNGLRHRTKNVVFCWNPEACGVVGPETERQAFDTKWQYVTATVGPSCGTARGLKQQLHWIRFLYFLEF